MEKHELSKIEFEIIDKALKALLQSNLDPITADKVTDLRNVFQDAYTGWLEIDQEAAQLFSAQRRPQCPRQDLSGQHWAGFC